MTDKKSTSLLERYQRIIELSRDLASTLDLNTLLNRIVHAAADVCNAEAASILLYDEIKHQLYFQAATNMETPLMQGLIVPVDASIAGWIVTERQPVIQTDARKDPRHFGDIAKPTGVETTSLLGVPLIAKEKVVGVLEAINKISGDFSADDQAILLALGAQAAVAIENARLFQQSDLISEMVHELRTPLASLNAAAHLLQRPDLPETQKSKIVVTMQRETQRLSEMTSSFLDLARLESGRTQFKVDLIDLKMLLDECSIVVCGKAEEKEIDLQIKVYTDIPYIKADRDKLKQVFLNLLSNAINYTPPQGSILLSAAVSDEQVIIQVADTGCGIHPQDLPHIFEKFYRVPRTEGAAQGTGLGLSICKRIVEAHNGWIQVQSQRDVGTTFTIYLPLKPSSRGKPDPQTAPAELQASF